MRGERKEGTHTKRDVPGAKNRECLSVSDWTPLRRDYDYLVTQNTVPLAGKHSSLEMLSYIFKDRILEHLQ